MQTCTRSSVVIGITVQLAICVGANADQTAGVRTVRFTTTDHVEIVGDFYKPAESAKPAPVAILLPMYQSDRAAWKPLAETLRKTGFAVFAIDMRGHGESGGDDRSALQERVRRRDSTLFGSMYLDVAAAHTWLSHQEGCDLTRVALVGASIGCSVAIDYGSRDRSVDVVVAMTPGTNYLGVDSTKPIAAFGDRPILLLATEKEREATDVLADLNPAVVKEIVGPGKIHGTHMFGKVSEIESRIAKYLKRHVGAASRDPVVSLFGSEVYYASESAAGKAAPPGRRELRWYSSAKEAEARGVKKASGMPQEGD